MCLRASTHRRRGVVFRITTLNREEVVPRLTSRRGCANIKLRFIAGEQGDLWRLASDKRENDFIYIILT